MKQTVQKRQYAIATHFRTHKIDILSLYQSTNENQSDKYRNEDQVIIALDIKYSLQLATLLLCLSQEKLYKHLVVLIQQHAKNQYLSWIECRVLSLKAFMIVITIAMMAQWAIGMVYSQHMCTIHVVTCEILHTQARLQREQIQNR